ncbi:hypothetical protein [Oceanospirillum linum]|uniref:FagA protein n=1 Tax=Oceanospirillum linum TaxID=966 RepID=A0A1T1HE10_OCELI|nr:hypothetical protein [Oceanospirillum linum]OOV88053.1 hypothetical protein BTA35_0200380 [Oceanospirillum linum]SEF41486.1 hypothetical protein SAMN04489856_10177 [Oleiphilus messinensis]SMP00700.1 hypothetical protein SAMN06264348_10178 [Oceanospirillum linum]
MQEIQTSRVIQGLRWKIRYATEPDNPSLLQLWLNMEHRLCQTQDRDDQWQHHQGMLNLLIDSYSDELNPPHWRALCLDWFCKPLGSLSRLACNRQHRNELNRLIQEVSTLSHFFKPDFTRCEPQDHDISISSGKKYDNTY